MLLYFGAGLKALANQLQASVYFVFHNHLRAPWKRSMPGTFDLGQSLLMALLKHL